MRKLLIASSLIVAACASGGNDRDDVDPVADRVGDWSTNLSSQNNSGIRGSAKAQSVGVGTGVTISISGARSGAQHPWHVHRGTCGSGGAIVGAANAYPLLTVGTDGTASANASISGALNEQERYHVNVHRSPTDLGTIVSCGNLDN